MRWLFLSLLTLNILFAVWHQQEAPPSPKQVLSVPGYQEAKDPIQLVREVPDIRPRMKAPTLANEACVFLGGLESKAAAGLIAQRLLSLDIDAQTVSVDESVGVDYWVYLPPLATRAAALRQLRELQSRNIDSYVITVGDLANGVSLGIFSQKDSAQAVAARIGEMGYGAEIRDLPRRRQVFWVRLEPDSRRLLDGQLLESLLKQEPGLQHRQMPCDAIATQG